MIPPVAQAKLRDIQFEVFSREARWLWRVTKNRVIFYGLADSLDEAKQEAVKQCGIPEGLVIWQV